MLFAYGTLKRGFYWYREYALDKGLRYLGESRVSGLIMYSLGSYPCAVRSVNPDDRVSGEVFEVIDESVFEPAARMELDAGYKEDIIETEFGPAVVFLYMQAPTDGLRVIDGVWSPD